MTNHGDTVPVGAYLWTLKDKIDRDWMRGYQQLPSMEEMAAAQKLQKASESDSAVGFVFVCLIISWILWC